MRIPIESSTTYRGRNSRPNWFALVAFEVLGFGAGGLGAVFSPAFSNARAAWYAGLAKSPWTPPDHVYGPVWSVLYLLMGIAAWIVWSERYHRGRTLALLAFAVQLLLNAAWAPLFFGTRSAGLGLLVIIALWLSLVWTAREFFAVRTIAACLMLPHVAWVSFAVVLNLTLWRNNP